MSPCTTCTTPAHDAVGLRNWRERHTIQMMSESAALNLLGATAQAQAVLHAASVRKRSPFQGLTPRFCAFTSRDRGRLNSLWHRGGGPRPRARWPSKRRSSRPTLLTGGFEMCLANHGTSRLKECPRRPKETHRFLYFSPLIIHHSTLSSSFQRFVALFFIKG